MRFTAILICGMTILAVAGGCEKADRRPTTMPAVGSGDDLMAGPGLKQKRLDACDGSGDAACQ